MQAGKHLLVSHHHGPEEASPREVDVDLIGDLNELRRKIQGSNHDDTLIGNAGPNDLYAGPGNDAIDGSGGEDWVYCRTRRAVPIGETMHSRRRGDGLVERVAAGLKTICGVSPHRSLRKLLNLRACVPPSADPSSNLRASAWAAAPCVTWGAAPCVTRGLCRQSRRVGQAISPVVRRPALHRRQHGL
jgi:RTX calcium-binding nonapeptide repeat (4 copies)